MDASARRAHTPDGWFDDAFLRLAATEDEALLAGTRDQFVRDLVTDPWEVLGHAATGPVRDGDDAPGAARLHARVDAYLLRHRHQPVWTVLAAHAWSVGTGAYTFEETWARGGAAARRDRLAHLLVQAHPVAATVPGLLEHPTVVGDHTGGLRRAILAGAPGPEGDALRMLEALAPTQPPTGS